MFQWTYRSIIICIIALLSQGQLLAAASSKSIIVPRKHHTKKVDSIAKQTKKLFSAAEAKNTKDVQCALEAGVSVNTVNKEGKTALLIAAENNDLRTGRLLLEKEADPNIPAPSNPLYPDIGLYPLHAAIANKSLDFIELLLKHKADPCVCIRKKHTSLHLALETESPIIFNRLLTTRCRDLINTPDEHGIHLLSHASCGVDPLPHASLGIAAALVQVGAHINTHDKFGRTPLHYAATAGNIPAAILLLRNGAKIMAAQEHPIARIHTAIKSSEPSDPTVIEQISCRLPNYPTLHEGRTSLHIACQKAHAAMINLLLDHGAQESSALFSITPLTLLIEHAENENLILSVLDKLLVVGNPNVPMTNAPLIHNIDYQNPLATALCKGYARVTQKILTWFKEHKEVIDNTGASYINGFCNLCAANREQPNPVDDTYLQAILDDLLTLGADPLSHNSTGFSAFHLIPALGLNPKFLETIALKRADGLFQQDARGIGPIQIIQAFKGTKYKHIIKKAQAAFISRRVEHLVEDQDGLMQEYDIHIGDVSRLLEYNAIFEHVPGYDRLKNIIMQHGATKQLSDMAHTKRFGHISLARGSRFELETAFDLFCAGKKIERFGAHYDGKEFDIETQETLVECKDINWRIQTSDLETFLLEHKAIAEKHGKKFKFYSRRPIPDEWQQRLHHHKIDFKDTLDVASRDLNQAYELAASHSLAASSSYEQAASSSSDASSSCDA